MCEKCDPIVREVQKFREEHAKKFAYNLRSIYEDLIEQERLSGRWFIHLRIERPQGRLKCKSTTYPEMMKCCTM